MCWKQFILKKYTWSFTLLLIRFLILTWTLIFIVLFVLPACSILTACPPPSASLLKHKGMSSLQQMTLISFLTATGYKIYQWSFKGIQKYLNRTHWNVADTSPVPQGRLFLLPFNLTFYHWSLIKLSHWCWTEENMAPLQDERLLSKHRNRFSTLRS